MALGSSLTTRNDWPEALAEGLTTCLARPVEITRVARAGAGSVWGETAVAEVVAEAPDLVLIEFAINDADLRDGIGLRDSIARHDRILEGLAAGLPDARLLLMTMSHAHGLRGLMRPRLRSYYDSYRGLAAQHDTGLADLYPRWRVSGQHFADGLHPDDAAVRAVALPVLLGMIGAAADRACG